MFSVKILKLLLVVLISLTSALFVGCNVMHYEEPDMIVISKSSKLCIVYGSQASDYVIKNAKNLGNLLKERTGASVIVRSDWKFSEKNDLGPDNKSTVIILYGKTDQELSRSCYESISGEGYEGYTIKATGNHIVISATTEKLLLSAGEDFIADFSKNNQILEIPRDESIVNTTNNFFCIADRDEAMADFIIKDGVGKNAEALTRLAVKMIGKKSGKSINVYKESEYVFSENNQIIISLEEKSAAFFDTGSKTQTSSIEIEDNKLKISGSDEFSLQSAISSFIGEAIINCDKREDGCNLFYFSKDKTIHYSWNYPLPIIPACTLEKNSVTDIGEMRFEFSGANEQIYSSYSDILQKIDCQILDIQSTDEYKMSVFLKSNMKVYVKYYSNDSKINVTIIDA